jgi:hypothetical protein
MKHTLLRRTTISILTCVLLVSGSIELKASQPEYKMAEEPAGESLKDLPSPIEGESLTKPDLKTVFHDFKEKLSTSSPFWRDTALDFKIRTYYFYRDFKGSGKVNDAWALGGWIDYASGFWMDHIQIGATGYTSQKLYGPEDRDGTLLLAPGQKSFSVLGQAYLNIKIIEEINLKFFRQTFDLPYINKNDSRMVPNTHEAYSLKGRSFYKTDFLFSHVTRMKTRNSTDFEYMSEVAGFPDTNKGVTVGGVGYSIIDNHYIGAITQWGWEMWNTLYAEYAGSWDLNDKLELGVGTQFTDQSSVGDEFGGDFQTYVFGGKTSLSYSGAILTFAFSTIGNDKKIQNPWGGYPGYLSLMLSDFNMADEDAWLVGLSYDCSNIGLEGVSAFANYANGNTPDSGINASPDEQEVNVTVDYRIKKDSFKGLWFRFRWAYLDVDGPNDNDVNHIRVIVNYEASLL